MADIVTETEDAIYIDDLKTVGKLKVVTPAKYYYNVREMNYDQQLAAYAWMYQQQNPDNKKPIYCRHLVVTKMEQGFYQVLPFLLPGVMLIHPLQEFFRGVEGIAELLKNKDWHNPPITWDDAIGLRDPNKEDEADDEEDAFRNEA
jgi:hypothetical protein